MAVFAATNGGELRRLFGVNENDALRKPKPWEAMAFESWSLRKPDL